MLRYQKVNKEEFDHLFDVLINVVNKYKIYDTSGKVPLSRFFETVKFDINKLFESLDITFIKIKWLSKSRLKAYVRMFDQLAEIATQYKKYQIGIDVKKAQLTFIEVLNCLPDKLGKELSILSEFDGFKV